MKAISINDLKKLNNKFIMYGVSGLSDFLTEKDGCGLSPLCYCDDDADLQGAEIRGVKILSFAEMNEQYGKDFPVFISSNSVSAIGEKLSNYCFSLILFPNEDLKCLNDYYSRKNLFSEEDRAGFLPRKRLRSHLATVYDHRLNCNYRFDKFLDSPENRKYIDSSFIVVPDVTHILTTRCVLNCKYCAQLQPFFRDGECMFRDFPVNECVDDIETMLSAADEIGRYLPIGGELFLHPGLDIILQKVASSSKIKKIEIVTSGTVIPSKKVLELLSKYKILVSISNYKELSPKLYELQEIFCQMHINYQLLEREQWVDHGVPYKRNRSDEQNAELFSKCAASTCNTLLDGKFFSCYRASHGSYLDLFNSPEFDYVDIRNKSKEEIRDDLRKFYLRDYTKACEYCDGFLGKIIPAAEQCSPDYSPWEELKKIKETLRRN